MATPEGKVKDRVKRLFSEYGSRCYYFMPVQTGRGAPGLDFHCSMCGVAFFVETKAGTKSMTSRQETTAARMRLSGARVFVVNEDPVTLKELRAWLEFTFRKSTGGLSSP